MVTVSVPPVSFLSLLTRLKPLMTRSSDSVSSARRSSLRSALTSEDTRCPAISSMSAMTRDGLLEAMTVSECASPTGSTAARMSAMETSSRPTRLRSVIPSRMSSWSCSSLMPLGSGESMTCVMPRMAVSVNVLSKTRAVARAAPGSSATTD